MNSARFSDELIITTDDGSYGRQGFVTTALKEILSTREDVCEVIAIGPIPMMKACSETGRPVRHQDHGEPERDHGGRHRHVRRLRVTVGGKMKFACVDGPDFDGHLVDFDELGRRHTRFRDEEQRRSRA